MAVKEFEVLESKQEDVAELLEKSVEEGGRDAGWLAVLQTVEELVGDLRKWQQRANFEGMEFLEWSLGARNRLKSVWDLVDCGDWRVQMEVEAWRGRQVAEMKGQPPTF